MDIKEQILVALGLNKAEEEVKLAWQSKGEDGTIYVSTAEELESGVDISVLTEDGTTILLPIGTYKTEDGVSFRVEEEGVVAEVMESETEEVDTVEEEEMSKESVELAPEDDDRKEEADVEDWAGMEKRIQNLEDAVADLKREKEGGDDEVEEMAEETKEPSTNPKTITTKEVVEFSAEDEIEKLKAENEKLKTELAASPADAPINTNKFSSEKPGISEVAYNKLSKRERILMDLVR
tara:strand:- start:2181 stop:2891 length:711 start_codon:yes stop_codon:yes gene_type:complete